MRRKNFIDNNANYQNPIYNHSLEKKQKKSIIIKIILIIIMMMIINQVKSVS